MKVIIFFVLLMTCSVFADEWHIKVQNLENKYLNYKTFYPAIFSEKGDFILGFTSLDVKFKIKGTVYALNLIHLKENNQVEVKSVALPITFLVGAAIVNNGREVIIVGEYGSKILIVNLANLKIKTIFEYEKNVPGFKTETVVVGFRNKAYLSGYFYDKEQYFMGEFVSLLHYKKDKVKFEKKINLRAIYKRHKNVPRSLEIVSGDTMNYVIANRQEKQSYLYHYYKGKIKLVDKALLVGGFAGSENRIFYTVLRDKDKRESFVKDMESGKVWPVGKKNHPYNYPFISKDGRIMVTATTDIIDKKMTVYSGKEDNNYELTKILDNVMMGPLKLSGNGAYLLHMHAQGIDIIPTQPPKDEDEDE